jgi:hypothetical protein
MFLLPLNPSASLGGTKYLARLPLTSQHHFAIMKNRRTVLVTLNAEYGVVRMEYRVSLQG